MKDPDLYLAHMDEVWNITANEISALAVQIQEIRTGLRRAEPRKPPDE